MKFLISLVPFLGTTIGSLLGTVKNFNSKFGKEEDTLVAVAAGILSSISLNLLLETTQLIRYKSVYIGICVGIVFTLLMNSYLKKTNANRREKLFWAMLIHNIPEGIITGISLASSTVLPTISVILSITLQNIPDGIVVSMPLVPIRGKKHAVLLGIISGIVEPIGAILLIVTTGKLSYMQMLEPFLIGFSFSAIFMIVIELFRECERKNLSLITAAIAILINSIL